MPLKYTKPITICKNVDFKPQFFLKMMGIRPDLALKY